jgi:hypothetical protein
MPRGLSPYNEELLTKILKDGDAVLNGSYKKFNQRMRIDFICKCGIKTNKRFEMLNLHRMPYCKDCSVKEMIEKQKKTWLAKYGVENPGMVPEIKKMINESYIKKYGMHPLKTEEIKNKRVKTCLKKYGGHPNQNKEVQEKTEANSYKFKEYTTQNGIIIKYQGYEDVALDELFEKEYNEDDIIVGRGRVPIINYTINDKKHTYFPDIYIKSENKIIEVKSEWTILLKRGNIVEKAEATINKGFLYEIWIYDSYKNKVNEILYNEYIK